MEHTADAEVVEASFPAVDGWRLHGRIARPGDRPPRAAIVIHPATSTPARYYEAFSAWLAGHGFAVLTYDYRGIGRGRPRGGLRGFEASMSTWANSDAVAAIDWLRTQYPDQPLFIIGHSLGGQIGLAIDGPRPDAAFFVAAQSGSVGGYGLPKQIAFQAIWRGALPVITATFGHVPKWTGMGEDTPTGVARQWARWCLRPDYFLGDHPEFAERMASYRGSVLSLSFSDDGYAPRNFSAWVDARLSGAQLEVRHLRPSSVGMEQIGHFGFFRRAGRASLWPMALVFFERVLADRTPCDVSELAALEREIQSRGR